MLVQYGFLLLTLICFGLLLWQLRIALTRCTFPEGKKKRIFNRVLIALFSWGIFTAVLAYSGFLNNWSSTPPRFAIIILIPLITILTVSFSKTATEILKHVPPQVIIHLQSFRIFVEILIWLLVIHNVMPVQMSFEGRNFDIIAGITAPVIAWLFARGSLTRNAVRIWNYVCLLLLLNIVTIAILSTPLPFRVFMNEPANTIVTTFPVIVLPAFLVPLAYGLHILSLRQMAMLPKS